MVSWAVVWRPLLYSIASCMVYSPFASSYDDCNDIFSTIMLEITTEMVASAFPTYKVFP